MAYTTIDDPELYFQIKLYTGNGTDDTAITLDGAEDMAPNFVWIKKRNSAEDHVLFDTIRGATKYIKSNANEAEATDTGSLKAFASDGFTLGTAGRSNNNTNLFLACCWKESATAGFDILTYVGNHTSGRTVAHGLSAVPEYMIIKNLNSAEKPAVYHKGSDTASPEDYLMVMSDTSAKYNDLSFLNDTAPTSSIFTLGNTQGISEDGSTMVAYLWTSIQGYSKFGSYVGNGNADGTFVYTGLRPAYVICKNTTGTGNWGIKTAKSQAYNGADVTLFANSTSAESAFSDNKVDILSNGFKIRTASSDFNTSGSNYIYMAFAEQPLVNSNGVPCNAR